MDPDDNQHEGRDELHREPQTFQPRVLPRAPQQNPDPLANRPADDEEDDFGGRQDEDSSTNSDESHSHEGELPEIEPEPPPYQEPAEAEEFRPRRGARDRRANPRYHGDDWVNWMHWRKSYPSPEVSFAIRLDWSTPASTDEMHHYESLISLHTDAQSGLLNDSIPLLFSAKASDADSPTLREILALPDDEERNAWIEAMYLELDQLQDKGTFVVVDRSEAGNRQVVPSTWAFKRKRYPDGSIMKLKARFCVRGDRQWEVINGHEETHAPVVEWGTLRVLFSLMLNFNMHTTQIDFRNAFVQSDLPEPIFLELPPGPFRENPAFQGKVLKVYKSLYGDRRAPRLWFQHLRQHLVS